jgi:hypothetical protein
LRLDGLEGHPVYAGGALIARAFGS